MKVEEIAIAHLISEFECKTLLILRVFLNRILCIQKQEENTYKDSFMNLTPYTSICVSQVISAASLGFREV